MRRIFRTWLGAAALGLTLAASSGPLVGCEQGELEEAGEELDDELDDATDDR
jgi:hypothetical protein